MLSVIIPTRNRAVLLEKALKSLLIQTLSHEYFEVIVVDNGSSDETAHVTNSYLDKLVNLRYVSEPSPGLHNARHKGILEAKSDILVFCDDDIEAFPTWLEGVFETFNAYPETVLVGGKSLPLLEMELPAWLEHLWQRNEFGRVHGWLSLIDLGDLARPIPSDYVYGCNFSIRRSVLQACGGFHPDSMPWSLKHLRGDGETHVSRWIADHGLIARYNPLVSVYHHVPKERMNIRYLCQRAFLQGISHSYFVTRQTHSLRQRISTIIRRIVSVLFYQVVCGREGIRRHWLYLVSGLIWHQVMIIFNPSLLVWINKENYFE